MVRVRRGSAGSRSRACMPFRPQCHPRRLAAGCAAPSRAQELNVLFELLQGQGGGRVTQERSPPLIQQLFFRLGYFEGVQVVRQILPKLVQQLEFLAGRQCPNAWKVSRSHDPTLPQPTRPPSWGSGTGPNGARLASPRPQRGLASDAQQQRRLRIANSVPAHYS